MQWQIRNNNYATAIYAIANMQRFPVYDIIQME